MRKPAAIQSQRNLGRCFLTDSDAQETCARSCASTKDRNAGKPRDDPTRAAVPEELVPALWLASQTATVVSLGAWCGVKMAMRAVGVCRETLPFDWLRVSMEGVLKALREDFVDFLEYSRVVDGPHSQHFIQEGSHSFLHDKPTKKADCDKYLRRIARFRELRATTDARLVAPSLTATAAAACARRSAAGHDAPILFVRAVATTTELFSIESLLELLEDRFVNERHATGPAGVNLLLIIDHQPTDRFLFFADTPGVLICTIAADRCAKDAYEIERPPFVTAYHEPIAAALWHLASGLRPEPHVELPSLRNLFEPHGCGLLQHVSLGEDLTTSMSYDPQVPPMTTLRSAATLDKASLKRQCVVEGIRAHLGRCRRLGMTPHLPALQSDDVAQLFVDACADRNSSSDDWESVS